MLPVRQAHSEQACSTAREGARYPHWKSLLCEMKNVKEECRNLRQNQTLMMEQLTRIEDFISKPQENNAYIHPTSKLSESIVNLAFDQRPSYYIAIAGSI